MINAQCLLHLKVSLATLYEHYVATIELLDVTNI